MAELTGMDQASGENFHLYCGDCVEVLAGVPDETMGFGIWSPPFCSLYTFSDDPRDMSNSRRDADFWEQYRYLSRELFRVMKPGRLISTHCMNLPTSKMRDGFIGIRDFRGDLIKLYQEAGFHFHSEVVIRKDPVAAMQRTKALGLLHKQVAKDSTLSRMAIPDYVVTMRKPGENSEPVSGHFDAYYGNEFKPDQPIHHEDNFHGRTIQEPGSRKYSIAVWQRYAEPVWMDIDQGDVLSHKGSRDVADERHIAPLQLTVIRRCIDLWSNPGDTVLSPFAGIGSEGYVALQMKRRFVGVELKPSYFKQAVRYLRDAEHQPADMFASAGG